MANDCYGYRIFVWDDKKVLEVDNGNGCTTTINASELSTLLPGV